jgi:soluble lytic murein transglycosylase-like protein
MGLVLHTLAPSVSKPTPEMLSEGTEWRTKPACLENDVICLIHEYSAKYGIETDIALRVAEAESNFKADAINYNTNGTRDLGVMQINDIHGLSDECRLNARCNIEWAMEKMSTVGTTPWYSSKHRWYE